MDSLKRRLRGILGVLIVFFVMACSFSGINSPQSDPISETAFPEHTAVMTAALQMEGGVPAVGKVIIASVTPTPEQNNPNGPSANPSTDIPGAINSDQTIAENNFVIPTPQPTPPKPHSVFGMQLNLLTPAEGLTQAAIAGSFWVQAGAISWEQVESYEGERNWAALSGREQEWLNSASLGLMPIVTIHFTPSWAQREAGYSCGPIKKEKFSAFGNFLYDLVSRYSKPPYNIKYWQIWNEADAGLGLTSADSAWGCWGNTTDQMYYGGDYFGEMLKAVYPRIKEADPQAQVLIAGLLLDCDPFQPPENPAGSGVFKDCSNAKFLTGILSVGAGDYFDGISFHSYDYYQGELGKFANSNWHSSWDRNGSVLTAKTSYIKNILSQFGVNNKSLFNTESGVICGKTGEEDVCIDNNFVQTKAYYVTEAYAAALAEKLEGNLWYSLKGWRASGLLDGTMQPVPAFTAYQFAAQQLRNAVFEGYITDYPGVRGMIFHQEGLKLWILWSQDGNAHTIQLNSAPIVIYDVYGIAQAAGTQLTITQAPQYIIWQP